MTIHALSNLLPWVVVHYCNERKTLHPFRAFQIDSLFLVLFELTCAFCSYPSRSVFLGLVDFILTKGPKSYPPVDEKHKINLEWSYNEVTWRWEPTCLCLGSLYDLWPWPMWHLTLIFVIFSKFEQPKSNGSRDMNFYIMNYFLVTNGQTDRQTEGGA